MYDRAKELKDVLDAIEEFNNVIYDDGIFKDMRFKFSYQNETFLLIYKFDYSNPRLYRVRKDRVLSETKDVIVPKEIKKKIEDIHARLKGVNDKFYPLIPGHEYKLGSVTFHSKFFNEYTNKNKIVDFISITYDVMLNEKKIDEVEVTFVKRKNKWALEKEKMEKEEYVEQIKPNLSIFKNEIIKKLNSFENTEDLVLKATELFLKETE